MDEKKTLHENSPRPFRRAELICALLLYPAAYIYIVVFGSHHDRLWFGVFVLLFIAITELLNRGRPHPKESWVWLGCMVLMSACVTFGWGRVWDYGLTMVLIHPLAVWWLLSRSGALLEGESGHLLPLDAINGFIRIPFGNFFLRLRCLWQGLLRRNRDRGNSRGSRWAGLLAVAAALVLLGWAATSLTQADEGFERLTSDVLRLFRFDWGGNVDTYIFRFIASIPVGAWLFGLMAGSARLEQDRLRTQAEAVNGFLPRLRLVPNRVWTVCMAAFAGLYLLFFVVQFRYLFGAFTRSLPEGFIVSQYAREGFFELCRVMGINFSLLYLVSRSGAKPIREDKVQRIFCTLLLAAGMVFAVIALSKLGLYISCFGFTPKRLQSCWLALVLFAGCIACLVSIWSRKKSFRAWMMFAAISLTLLHLY